MGSCYSLSMNHYSLSHSDSTRFLSVILGLMTPLSGSSSAQLVSHYISIVNLFLPMKWVTLLQ